MYMPVCLVQLCRPVTDAQVCDAIERFGEDILGPAGQWLKADGSSSGFGV